MLTEREEAYRVLLLWQKDGAFIKESGLSPFAMEIALGVCRRHLYLEYFIKTLTKRMPALEVKIVLEMGLFQLFFMEVPDYAAINSSVELARSANLGDGAASLVNAVLRAARKAGAPELPPQRVRRVSIENSVPEWIVRRWFDIYGGDEAEAMARATLERPTEWLRVNLQKASAPVIVQRLGIPGASILYDRFVELPHDAGVKAILASPEFVEGKISFQNPSAYEVVKLLDAKPGMSVWDACAAPGGKTALLAEMDPSLDILATDPSEHRLEKMKDLMDRLGLTNVKIACVDALAPSLSSLVSRLSFKFDRILLDVPCSNMGVVARRPESVYRLTQESLKELASLQLRILESAARFLKPGGRLVYATCSPDPMETTQVISKFLKGHPEFAKVGEPVLPGKKDARFDGFFAQALEKVGEG
ncbi:MAG: methyltransferase domain-containing protein [Fibrobacter sp.]|uniref:transcription antitermination factor NusB n=1 Tax=Fibrobacter sp. TaxID=35828 RepID=UPI001B1FBBF7|nr:transcription antitermination factor NusB [Fibrobacter sp.]MBO7059877.1 methyltransferase domain-containing protein [Fibrobacter sp.]